MNRLQRQAATARRYQVLKQEERKLIELLALRLRVIEQDSQSKEGILRERDTAMQALIADLRSIEASIESAREDFTEKSEALNAVQGALLPDRRRDLAHRAVHPARPRAAPAATSGAGAGGAGRHRGEPAPARDQSQVDELRSELEQLEPGLPAARDRERLRRPRWRRPRSRCRTGRSAGKSSIATRAPPAKDAVERARIEQLEHQLTCLAAQRERLQGELSQLTTTEIDVRLKRRRRSRNKSAIPASAAPPAARGHRGSAAVARACASSSPRTIAADSNCRTRKDA